MSMHCRKKFLNISFLMSIIVPIYRQEGKRMDKRKTTGKLLMKLKNHNGWGCSHSIRVSRYAVETGKCLGLNDKEIDCLFTAALLHDIGKLFIPKRLLDKPGKLTKAEYRLMKCHAGFGYLLLKILGYPKEIGEAVRNHHERYDGRGYRRKKEISLFAAIICVADAYDAMKHSRPYRETMDDFEIYCAMATGSGEQFNPVIWRVMSGIVFPVKQNLYGMEEEKANDSSNQTIDRE